MEVYIERGIEKQAKNDNNGDDNKMRKLSKWLV